VIGGKTYEFCCPPCIDEFVILAKEDPDRVLPPEAYVQEG
jgi:YHS domain-containing protein